MQPMPDMIWPEVVFETPEWLAGCLSRSLRMPTTCFPPGRRISLAGRADSIAGARTPRGRGRVGGGSRNRVSGCADRFAHALEALVGHAGDIGDLSVFCP
jgi:hypothetical protein